MFAMRRGAAWTETFPNLPGYHPILQCLPSNSIPSFGPQNISSFKFPSPDSDRGKETLLEQIVLKEIEELTRTDKSFQKVNWYSYI